MNAANKVEGKPVSTELEKRLRELAKDWHVRGAEWNLGTIQMFAAEVARLSAEIEREECASLLEHRYDDASKGLKRVQAAAYARDHAAAIRARGGK
jgi:hypothetical protein